MTDETLPDVVEGFEELSTDEHIEYVQNLWGRILSRTEHGVAVPEWHREVLDERLKSRELGEGIPWEEVKVELRDALVE